MAFRAEVIVDNSGEWVGNALVFATKEEAEEYVTLIRQDGLVFSNLMWRWTAVRETRVVETDDPVNYKWVDRQAVPLSE